MASGDQNACCFGKSVVANADSVRNTGEAAEHADGKNPIPLHLQRASQLEVDTTQLNSHIVVVDLTESILTANPDETPSTVYADAVVLDYRRAQHSEISRANNHSDAVSLNRRSSWRERRASQSHRAAIHSSSCAVVLNS